MRTRSRCALFVAVPLLLTAILTPVLSAAPSSARPQPNSAEAILFNSANRDRAAAGLPQFQWDTNLAAAARAHAQRMAQMNTLSHQFPGEPPMQVRATQAGARFSMIAENVAEGPSPQGLHNQWMHSAPHRANLLDPDLNSIGIAVVPSGNMLFAAEDFSVAVEQLSIEDQEAQISSQLAARGLHIVNAVSDARKTCQMDRGFSGQRPLTVLRYETSDLNQLPDEVYQKATSGKYHSVAVGACEADTSGTFARFRFAILFY